jgi:hypothetical protein
VTKEISIIAVTEEHGGAEPLSQALGESLREDPIPGVMNLQGNPLATRLGIHNLGQIDIKSLSLTELRELRDMGLPEDCDEGTNICLRYKSEYTADDYSSNVYEQRLAARNSDLKNEVNPVAVINFHQAPSPGNDIMYVSGTKYARRTRYDAIALGSTLILGRMVYVGPDKWPGHAITHSPNEVVVDISDPPGHPMYHGRRRVIGMLRTVLKEMVMHKDDIVFSHCHTRDQEYTLLKTLRDGDPDLDDLNEEYSGVSDVIICTYPRLAMSSLPGQYAVCNFGTRYRPVRGELLRVEQEVF